MSYSLTFIFFINIKKFFLIFGDRSIQILVRSDKPRQKIFLLKNSHTDALLKMNSTSAEILKFKKFDFCRGLTLPAHSLGELGFMGINY